MGFPQITVFRVFFLSEVELAKTCLNYLLFDTFNNGPAPDKPSFGDQLAKYRFARYAARHWGTHVRNANGEKDPITRKLLRRLGQSLSRLDVVSELSVVDEAADWKECSWDRGKTLFHLFAENGLTIFAQELMNADGQKVSPLSVTCRLMINR